VAVCAASWACGTDFPADTAITPIALWPLPVYGDSGRNGIYQCGSGTGGKLVEDYFSPLMRAIAENRDRQAFADLFGHFAPRLKSFAMRAGADATTAEEIAQDTMLTVWRRAETFDGTKSSVSTWVFTIARNKRIDLVRRERRHDLVLEIEDRQVDPSPTPSEMVERFQTSRQIANTIEELPDDQASVLRMAFLEDKSHVAIAENLGLPLGTVKSRIRLGLGKMRTLLEECGR